MYLRAEGVYCSILMPLVMGVFEKIFPYFQPITQDPLLDVICYILVVGIGLAILFSRNASSGGLDNRVQQGERYMKPLKSPKTWEAFSSNTITDQTSEMTEQAKINISPL